MNTERNFGAARPRAKTDASRQRFMLALLLAAAVALGAGALAACSSPAADSPTTGGSAASTDASAAASATAAQGEGQLDFDLATFANPFIGTWESEIPSAGTKLTFTYKPDGTFDYVMEGVPAEQGGEGSGGYLVSGDTQISYLDFEGAAAYIFKVVDNDTIDVTEITEVGADGTPVLGNTAPFVRAAGSSVTTVDTPFVLDNPFIGTWSAQIPDDEDAAKILDVTMEYRTDGTALFSADGQDFPQSSYTVYNDVLVTFDPSSNAWEMFQFRVVDDDTLEVSELLAVNADGSRELGATLPFLRIK